MKKTLIAAGCSYTSNTFQELKFWPELLAEELDMDCINLGRAGASNQFIHDRTIDQIYETKNIGLVVSAWSGFDRTIAIEAGEKFLDIPLPECPFGDYDVMSTRLRLSKAGNITQSRKYPRYMIEKGIRNMLSLASFCRDKDLPYLQFASLINCMPILPNKISELMLEYKPFMDLEKPNIIGWPFLEIIGGFNVFELLVKGTPLKASYEAQIGRFDPTPEKGHTFPEDDETTKHGFVDRGHPNQKGHQLVNNIIAKKYGEIYG